MDFLQRPLLSLLLAIQSASLSSNIRFWLSTLSPNLRSLLKGYCGVPASPGGKTKPEAVGRVQGISLPGGEMEDDAASGDRKGENYAGALFPPVGFIVTRLPIWLVCRDPGIGPLDPRHSLHPRT